MQFFLRCCIYSVVPSAPILCIKLFYLIKLWRMLIKKKVIIVNRELINQLIINGWMNMDGLFAKTAKSIFVILRYLGLELLKYSENSKNLCDTFDHNFKNFPL